MVKSITLLVTIGTQVLTIGMQILTVGTHLGTNPQHNHSFNHWDADINRRDASGHQSSIRQIRLCQNWCFYPTGMDAMIENVFCLLRLNLIKTWENG